MMTVTSDAASQPAQRKRVVIHGLVQGVGFRPFVHQLAHALGLAGWVRNTAQGVEIEVEGSEIFLKEFMVRLDGDKPTHAFIHGMETLALDPVGHAEFVIKASDLSGPRRALVMPDLAPCPVCLREMSDPANRRHRYPFINCTHCGPRFSIIESLPYDRARTTMRHFEMCQACRAEYENPADRRFHAEPIACPVCGPALAWWSAAGKILASGDLALAAAADALRGGAIVAIKGVGGFQLLADARSAEVVDRLRQRKHREEKPFALMYPSAELLAHDVIIGKIELIALSSPAAPIVLLRRRGQNSVAPSVAPGHPSLGVMLPSSPLHHLLMGDLGFPVVATSGNLSDEPICTDERDALQRLAGVADFFLVHNRPIVRHVDDSIVRVIGGRASVLRRARGYAPIPITLPIGAPPLLAVGGHLKNAVAVAAGRDVFLSQHIGDLETLPAFQAFESAAADMPALCDVHVKTIVSDLHPDYASTRWAAKQGAQHVQVQHHHAHIASCMAEHGLSGPVLGVAWDGTGYGTDGTVWGGEFLCVTKGDFDRVAALRSFRLPGGEQAMREPARAALGALFEAGFPRGPGNDSPLWEMLEKGINSPVTTSAGRLFDAVAWLLALCTRNSYEGQAAMMLENAIAGADFDEKFDLPIRRGLEHWILDWGPMIWQIAEGGDNVGQTAARFHNTMSEAIVAVARIVQQPQVVLSGGCFQNKYLAERTIRRLREEGFEPYWHQRVPPNDGGIALGQAYVAAQWA